MCVLVAILVVLLIRLVVVPLCCVSMSTCQGMPLRPFPRATFRAALCWRMPLFYMTASTEPKGGPRLCDSTGVFFSVVACFVSAVLWFWSYFLCCSYCRSQSRVVPLVALSVILPGAPRSFLGFVFFIPDVVVCEFCSFSLCSSRFSEFVAFSCIGFSSLMCRYTV